MNEDVFFNDISIWIKQGHITFYDAFNAFPKDWVLSSFDRNSFLSKYHLSSYHVQRNAVFLMRMLKIDELPVPNFPNLIKRFVADLNLPTQLAEICQTHFNLFKFDFFRDYFSVRSDKATSLPFYERYTFVTLLITIKKLFGLDGQTEKRNSALVQSINSEAFVWDNWEHQTSFWWKEIQAHYLPINAKLVAIFNPINLTFDLFILI